MWIFWKKGFMSGVVARDAQGQLDQSMIMVRSRRRAFLTALLTDFQGILGSVKILETTNTDYRYRIIISKGAWVSLVGALAAGVTYGNFKGECARLGTQGNQAHKRATLEYCEVLHDVWDVMHRMQRSEIGVDRETK